MERPLTERRARTGRRGMTAAERTRYGLLVPHFGVFADRERLLEGAKLAEAYGFDSVWVRDHLIFEPHGEM